MRIAALAFGVVAGLIASLILALGGLDLGPFGDAAADRQLQLTRFALYVIANIGVFGAGLVLATPLGGAILFVIGALAWAISAMMLHPGSLLVVIVPPVLLLIAAALSVIARVRRGGRVALAPLSLRRRRTEAAEVDEDVPAAGYYGRGDGQSMSNEPSIAGLDERNGPPLDWTPGKRRPTPPRQKPMFRPSEDDDEFEESGFSRVARGASSILSFGLYAAVAVAVMLVFWNLRSGDANTPAAAKLEPAPMSPAVAEAASSAPAPAAPVLGTPANDTTSVATTTQGGSDDSGGGTSIPPQLMNGVVVADDPSPPVTFEAPRNVLAAGGAEPQTTDLAEESPPPATSDPTEAGATVMPFPMPPEIAAGQSSAPSSSAPSATAQATPRAQPAPRTQPTPRTQLNTTGL